MILKSTKTHTLPNYPALSLTTNGNHRNIYEPDWDSLPVHKRKILYTYLVLNQCQGAVTTAGSRL